MEYLWACDYKQYLKSGGVHIALNIDHTLGFLFLVSEDRKVVQKHKAIKKSL